MDNVDASSNLRMKSTIFRMTSLEVLLAGAMGNVLQQYSLD